MKKFDCDVTTATGEMIDDGASDDGAVKPLKTMKLDGDVATETFDDAGWVLVPT